MALHKIPPTSVGGFSLPFDLIDHFAGCLRIPAKASNRVEAAALFVIVALFSSDAASVFSFTSAELFRFELSGVCIHFP